MPDIYSIAMKRQKEIEMDNLLQDAYTRGYTDGQRQERERVLDEIRAFVESYRIYRADGSLVVSMYITADELDEKLESLRQQGVEK